MRQSSLMSQWWTKTSEQKQMSPCGFLTFSCHGALLICSSACSSTSGGTGGEMLRLRHWREEEHRWNPRRIADHAGDGPSVNSQEAQSRDFFFCHIDEKLATRTSWRTAVNLERQITFDDVGSTVCDVLLNLGEAYGSRERTRVQHDIQRPCVMVLAISPHLCLCDATLIVTLKKTARTCLTSCLCVNRKFGKVSTSVRPRGSTVSVWSHHLVYKWS